MKISILHKLIINKLIENCDSNNCIGMKKAKQIIGQHFRFRKENVRKILNEFYRMDLVNVNGGRNVEILVLNFV